MLQKTELAMPAGNLQCALYAFKGGADAVYLGLKLFSARAGAVNFSFEDLRKLKTVCLEQNKKFYIALNTLVRNSDLPEVHRMLKELVYIKPDGVIVQDLGIVNIIRRCYPSLELHGSTQLAVHTAEGVKELQSLGFKRVVLSRELSFDEIAAIRKACPDIELKVFIHGALCYGFSGLCMASQKITGRSANCGACAQICRTWFTCRETGEDGRFFSMKDLCLGELVKKYRDIGIDSLKVEGRMKGPDYAYNTARYYRLLLDGKPESDTEVQWAKESSMISFARTFTDGFFHNGKNGSFSCEGLVTPDFASHRGIKVGKIVRVMNGKAQIKFSKPVALRDGLLVIYRNQAQGFALTYIDSSRSFISAGETAIVNFPSEKFSPLPESSTDVMCISRHDGNPALLNENIPLYKKSIDLDFILFPDRIEINGRVFPVNIQKANNAQNVKAILNKIFSSSDKSYFKAGNIGLENRSDFEHPFMMLSELKQIRRDFYAALDSEFEKENCNNPDYPEFKTEPYEIPANAVCLEPVMFDEKTYFEQLSASEPEVAGLNNVAHIAWAKKHPDTRVFADAFMYVKNSEALDLLKTELPNLEGCVSENDKQVPVFISRVCFRHNSLGLDCKGCSKNNTFHISQNGKNYKVVCKNCITTVTEEIR